MKPVSVHHHFRPLKTFFRWCVEADLLAGNPTRGITIRIPRTLPRVPEDDDVRRLLQICSQTFEGRRNRALIALLADSGLRISEALRLRIESVNFSTRTLDVRGGKGGKDGVGFFGAEAAHLLRVWLTARRETVPEDYLFVDRLGGVLDQTMRRTSSIGSQSKLDSPGRSGLTRYGIMPLPASLTRQVIWNWYGRYSGMNRWRWLSSMHTSLNQRSAASSGGLRLWTTCVQGGDLLSSRWVRCSGFQAH